MSTADVVFAIFCVLVVIIAIFYFRGSDDDF